MNLFLPIQKSISIKNFLLSLHKQLLCVFFLLPLTAFGQDWKQVTKSLGLHRSSYDNFGDAVSIDGNLAVVGAYSHDLNAAGTVPISDAGAVYLYSRDAINGTWTFVTKLVAQDRGLYENFGESVAISGDYIVVGASAEKENALGGSTLNNSGAAYVFYKNQGGNGNWGQVKKLVAQDRGVDDFFGGSVAISGDFIVVGAPNEDEDAAGANTVGSAGSAYVFAKDQGGTNNWGQVKKLVAQDRAAGDYFAWSVAISDKRIVVGAPYADGNTVSNSGCAYVFAKDQGGTGNWGQLTKLMAQDKGENDFFGWSVGINQERIVVGAFNEAEDLAGTNTLGAAGSAYLFSANQGGADAWGQVKKLVASDRAMNDQFGVAVAISGDNVLVGAYLKNGDISGTTLTGAGSAYVFAKDQGSTDNWGQVAKLEAQDIATDDRFGQAVAISGDNIIVGAYLKAEDLGDGNVLSTGSAYFFHNGGVLPVKLATFSAKVAANKVKLEWVTASEQNNSYFIIGRSADGINFSPIATVQGKGTTNTAEAYSAYDSQPIIGTSYYRLTQVDLNGKSTILGTQPLEFGFSSLNVSVYPNPTVNYFNVLSSIETDVIITALSGQVIKHSTLLKGNNPIDASAWPAGLYILKTIQGSIKLIKK